MTKIEAVYKKPNKVLYICDRKACSGGCHNDACFWTSDIEHAKNFKLMPNGTFAEIGTNDMKEKIIEKCTNVMNDDQIACLHWIVETITTNSDLE